MLRISEKKYQEARRIRSRLRSEGIIITMEEAYIRASLGDNSRAAGSIPEWLRRFDLK